LGYLQIPNEPSYTNPLTDIIEWNDSRFDFKFGCELSNTINEVASDVQELHKIPTDGIRKIRVTSTAQDLEMSGFTSDALDLEKFISGIWFYDVADNILFEFDNSADTESS